MTVDKEGECELTKLSNMPKAWELERKVPMRRQWGVPKTATMVIFTELRLRLGDQCKAQG